MAGCRPRYPRATRRRPTGRCRRRRWPSWAPGRSGSTCTSRSARSGAATATSTPIPAAELGDQPGASRATYAEAAIAEVRLARRVLGDRDLPVETVFFGGGTPTLLGAGDLASVLAAIAAEFGLASGVEVTTEANPDSVALWDLQALRDAGFTRMSFGMQSAVDHVLATLDRTHDPLRVPAVVDWSREAGFEQVSLDLIYGTPGESLDDWALSLETALACRPDHVSAYSLIVEPGTALARRITRGELPATDDDDLADKYLLADQRLQESGFGWYEVSNWARDPAAPLPPQRAVLDRRPLVGGRPGRAQPHRRRAVVERQAPLGVRRAAGRRDQPGRGTRDARRRDPPGRAGAARDPAPRRAAGAALWTRTAGPGRPAGRPGALELAAERLVLTREGRLLADAVVRDLLP